MKAIRIKDIVEAVSGTLAWGDGDEVVRHVSIDSRDVEEGTLFVPIVGERIDAHRFIPDVLEAGASCVFSSNHTIHGSGGACIYVEDTLVALQQAAAWYRSLFRMPVIGITGSVGKTTTKEMIAAVMEIGYHTVKTYKNLNSQIGVALMMFELDENTEMAVIEMGISMPGEMDRLVEIVRPECAVITNIGVSHIGNLGSRENICAEKGKIVRYIPKEGKVFVCGNGDMKELVCQNVSFDSSGKKPELTYYGTESGCSYYAKRIQADENGQHFTFCYPDGEEEVSLSVMGVHNVNNAIVALALAVYYHVPLDAALHALSKYCPIDMRGVVHHVDGVHIIDDTYNASPDSITGNLRALFDYPGDGRRIAVLADVLELGEDSPKLHEGIGKYIVSECEKERKLDLLVTVGTEAFFMADYVREHSDIPVVICADREQAVREIQKDRKDGDWILVKGSRGMKMDQVVEQLIKE